MTPQLPLKHAHFLALQRQARRKQQRAAVLQTARELLAQMPAPQRRRLKRKAVLG